MNPKDFKLETTSVWSFPERGKWATHNPHYRGNFAPQMARNLIDKYSNQGDFILDPMVGAGTTLIEAKLLHRNALGIDINPDAVSLTLDALNFEYNSTAEQSVIIQDSRDLSNLEDNIFDFILIHPPYLNIIKYSDGTISGDLSNISSVDKFCIEFKKIAAELFRVLKPNKYCSLLIGATRKGGHYIPLPYYLLKCFLDVDFALKEEIIKTQHNCASSNSWAWRSLKYNFYLIMHEHLFIFRKPMENEKLCKIKWSLKTNLS